ncbi:tail fiber assembly protein [Leclercia adecarboxylata]|uniref:tail fiber assembly protein n=1 Tax=Leclercia adecarboxylata TaxID=83655 RepID=UPI001117DD73|nr:tail fiber assembly protein [Leclercia adecarboxylata]QCZ26140.1 tail fiber assembly protein [Leclercia adecarboxylata]
MHFYSAKNNAFYDEELKNSYVAAGSWPDDAVEVSNEVFVEFISMPPAGKVRAPVDGLPAWADIPPPTHEELASSARTELQRRIDAANAYMNGKQWPGKAALGRLKGDELAGYNAWLDYLDALEAVDVTTAPDITWPDQPTV